MDLHWSEKNPDMAAGKYPCGDGFRFGAWNLPETVQFEGATLVLTADRDYKIEEGDTYIAGRNTGPQILTCRKNCDGFDEGWIQPEENAYSYDTWECRKVLSIDGEEV